MHRRHTGRFTLATVVHMEIPKAEQTPTPKEQRDQRQKRKQQKVAEAATTLKQSDKEAILHLGYHGALVERLMAAHDWRGLVTKRYAREYQTILGSVLALTGEGRLAHDTIGTESNGRTAHYLNGPNTVADRAYQVLAIHHLADLGYRIDDVILRRRNLNAAARDVTTNLVVCIRMRPPGDPYPTELVKDYGYPALHANIGQGGAGVPQLRRLAEKYRREVVMWQHPVMVAVPEVTAGMVRLVDTLREAKRCEVLRLIEIPLERPVTSG